MILSCSDEGVSGIAWVARAPGPRKVVSEVWPLDVRLIYSHSAPIDQLLFNAHSIPAPAVQPNLVSEIENRKDSIGVPPTDVLTTPGTSSCPIANPPVAYTTTAQL